MIRFRLTTFVACFGLLCLLIAGCGGGPQLGTVTGKVTLDGQPLESATVVFKPAEGRESVGFTDSQGNYELGFAGEDMGALLGKHTVRIVAATEDAEGNPLPNPIQLPARYNDSSELTAEVKSGRNTFDFDLQSN
jgi:hypothetical protein